MYNDKPSMTAYRVALSIVTLGAKPGMDRLLPPGTVQATEKLLVASGVAGPEMIRWCHSRQMVSVYEAFNWMLPGQFEAFAHRKAFCERQVREGIAAGATQILVLGAGYDTMGWRLALEFPDVIFFEIDHPATAYFKARGIDAMGRRDNLFLIAEDLGERKLAETLKTNESWDQSAQSLIVAEGLLMFLSSEAVRDLFTHCAVVTGNGSRIAFTYIPTGACGWPDAGQWTGWILWLQTVMGEPWIWSVEPEKLEQFLKKSGWTNVPELAGETCRYGVECYAVAKKRT